LRCDAVFCRIVFLGLVASPSGLRRQPLGEASRTRRPAIEVLMEYWTLAQALALGMSAPSRPNRGARRCAKTGRCMSPDIWPSAAHVPTSPSPVELGHAVNGQSLCQTAGARRLNCQAGAAGRWGPRIVGTCLSRYRVWDESRGHRVPCAAALSRPEAPWRFAAERGRHIDAVAATMQTALMAAPGAIALSPTNFRTTSSFLSARPNDMGQPDPRHDCS
jgi:hypothetical protein